MEKSKVVLDAKMFDDEERDCGINEKKPEEGKDVVVVEDVLCHIAKSTFDFGTKMNTKTRTIQDEEETEEIIMDDDTSKDEGGYSKAYYPPLKRNFENIDMWVPKFLSQATLKNYDLALEYEPGLVDPDMPASAKEVITDAVT